MSGIGSTESFEEAWWTYVVERWATLVLTTEVGERERKASVKAGCVGYPAAYMTTPDMPLGSGVPIPMRGVSSTTASRTKETTIVLRELLDLGKYAPTGEDYLTAFVRSLLVDLKQGTHRGYDPGKPQRLDQEDVSLLIEQDSRTSEDTTPTNLGRLFAWWASFSGPRATHIRLIEQFNRVFFITQGGYMGLGPPWLREDDAVCILSGGAVAYALRELDGGDRWSYVGEW